MSDENITRLPWKLKEETSPSHGNKWFEIIDEEGDTIMEFTYHFRAHSGETSNERIANARYAIKAINAYPSLIEENKRLREAVEIAMERMERARGILKREGTAQWGMLDTSDIKAAIEQNSKL